MARPTKIGLDYFPFDVDFFDDEKIEAISGEFGLKGELVVIKLLCAIYRNGYFIMWDELLKMKLIKRLPGVSKELLEQIVLRLVKWGFFNEGLFNSDSVLTSNGIQSRYSEATKRRSGSSITVYACNNGVNVHKNPVSDGVNDRNKPQSKVKESRVKKSKVLRGEEAPAPDFSGMTFAEQLAANEGIETRFNLKPNIPTKQQVWECFVRNDGTKEMAKKFWDEMEATGWYRKGSPVRNFAAIVPGWVTTWKEIESGRKGQKNGGNIKPDARAVDVHELLRQRQEEIERDKANSGQHV